MKPRLPRWCVITGPNLALENTTQLPPHVQLFAFRSDFPALLASCTLSISQAGYNSVCDILSARCRAVLVPFAATGETEQTMRAHELAQRGLARIVTEAELAPQALMAAIEAALSSPLPDHDLDLNGAEGAARLIRERAVTPVR
jgi:predicted glycosyltransferase